MSLASPAPARVRSWSRVAIEGISDWKVWALVIFLQLPAIQTVVRQAIIPSGAIPVWLALSGVFYIVLLHAGSGMRRLSPRAGKLGGAVIVAGVMAVSLIGYPQVDALKWTMRGSDRDDALTSTSQRLLLGQQPLYQPTYLGNAPSPGPLWALAVAPVTASRHTYFLLVPFALIALPLIVYGSGGSSHAGALTLLLLATSADWWRMILTGSDFGPIGVLFAALTAAINLPGRSLPGSLFCGVLLCVAASSRVVLALPAISIAAMTWLDAPRRAIGLILLAISATAVHYALWPLTEAMTPFHLVRGATDTLGPLGLLVGTLGCLLIGVRAAARRTCDTAAAWRGGWEILAFPLALMAGFDLWSVNFQLASWGGGTFIALAAPLLLGHVALSAHPSRLPTTAV